MQGGSSPSPSPPPRNFQICFPQIFFRVKGQLKWTAVNGSYSFQVLSIIVRLCTVVLLCNRNEIEFIYPSQQPNYLILTIHYRQRVNPYHLHRLSNHDVFADCPQLHRLASHDELNAVYYMTRTTPRALSLQNY